MQKYIHTTWRLWKLLRPFHKEFYLQLFFTVILQLMVLSATILTAKILDSVISNNFNFAFIVLLLWFLVNALRIVVTYFVDRRSQNNLDFKIQQFLEEYSFSRIFKLNPFQYQEDHSAIKLQVINRGEGAIENIVNSFVLTLIPTTIQIIFYLLAIAYYSPLIALITLLSLIIALMWSNYFSMYHRPFVKKDMDNWDLQRKIRSEAFQHLYLIKIFASSDFYLKKYLKNRMQYIDYKVFTWNKNLIHGTKRWSFFNFSKATTTGMIIYQATLGALTAGSIYALWRWINDTYENSLNIIRQMRQLPLRFVELDKYLEIIDKESDFDEHGKHKFSDGDIVFNNLSFKYPKGESNVLDNINITIPRGKKVAFVGASGSGKTTITRLLLRAYDYDTTPSALQAPSQREGLDADGPVLPMGKHGEQVLGSAFNGGSGGIYINNISLKDLDAHSLRRSIGHVEQHVDLFDDTIKNNILFGVDEKTLKKWEKTKPDSVPLSLGEGLGVRPEFKNMLDQKLEEISKLARIDEFYHRLGDTKFETEIGERGIKLSGGERQRIGIARAIIKDPAILIFDEATSALDTVNEKYIKEAIDNVSKGRTTIIIAHRLSTVQDSDIIFVMSLGKVVAQGTHSELLLSSTHYQDLINHQELK